MAISDLDRAILSYKDALEVNPRDAVASANLSLALFLAGDYRNGWLEYDNRFGTKRGRELLGATPQCPVWDSSLLTPASPLLLVSEQGLGDALQFMRYVHMFRHKGISVSLCAPANLHTLIQVAGIDPAPLTPDQANHVTEGLWIPILSVPRHLGVNPDNPIITEPYIRSTPLLVEKWRGILTPEQRPIIAIHWQGNPESEKTNANGRSLPLETFSPLASRTDVTLLSLQGPMQ